MHEAETDATALIKKSERCGFLSVLDCFTDKWPAKTNDKDTCGRDSDYFCGSQCMIWLRQARSLLLKRYGENGGELRVLRKKFDDLPGDENDAVGQGDCIGPFGFIHKLEAGWRSACSAMEAGTIAKRKKDSRRRVIFTVKAESLSV